MEIKILSILSIFVVLLVEVQARPPISGDRYELLSGVRSNKRRATNYKVNQMDDFSTGSPARFLADNYQYIQAGGKILDIRLRDGQNAVFLARKGYRVTGIESDKEFIKRAKMLTKEFDVKLNIIKNTIHKFKAEESTYDAIISFHFLNRSLVKKIMRWIKPGGVLIIEGHTVLNKDSKDFENVPKDYFLKEGELLNLFNNYKILKYEEPMHLKTYTSSIIIQKR